VQVCKLKALKLDLKKLNEEGFGNVVMHKKDLLDGIHELDTIYFLWGPKNSYNYF
jgi:hypothetical protein